MKASGFCAILFLLILMGCNGTDKKVEDHHDPVHTDKTDTTGIIETKVDKTDTDTVYKGF